MYFNYSVGTNDMLVGSHVPIKLPPPPPSGYANDSFTLYFQGNALVFLIIHLYLRSLFRIKKCIGIIVDV